jgi:glutathione S-transferase
MLRPRAHHRSSARATSTTTTNRTTNLPLRHTNLLSPRAAAPVPPPPPPFATIVPRATNDNPLSGMLSGLFGGGSGAKGGAGASAPAAAAAAAAAPTTATTTFSDNAPTWDALRDLVQQQEAQHDLSDRGGSFLSPDLENGPPHPLALRRLFGAPENEVEIVLYRDHAAWCPYCEKVVLQLEEKRIPYEIRKINMRCYGPKPADFMAKVPSGLLPVLEVDGRVVTESATIMALLEEKYAFDPSKHRPLMPAKGTAERSEADALLRLERRFFGDWLDWLCGGGGWGGGVDRNQQAAAQRRFELTVQAVCDAMPGPGPYFMGAYEPSLVDITFAPMLERAAASLAYYKGWYLRGGGGREKKFPQIDRWFDAMEQRPSYAAFRSDYFTHAHDLPPQLGGCTMTPEGQPVAAQIDGFSGEAWRLPLKPLSPTSMPEPYAGSGGGNTNDFEKDSAKDRLEAAARLVANHSAVVRFALRGPGKPGARPVSAPLADPSAIPAMEYEAAADAALRHVAHALLVGVGSKQAGSEALAVGAGGAGAGTGAPTQASAREVVAACEYLRDRVGVPRDLRFPAARQLRAHLNWFIDQVCAV